jgi:hypothetical protein
MPYDSIQADTLRALAIKCPYEEGVAVYYARAMMYEIEGFQAYMNECERVSGGSSARKSHHENDIDAPNITSNSMVKLYPNPANNELSIESSLSDLKNGSIEIYNLLGVQQYFQALKTGYIKFGISLVEYPQGIYIYKIRISGEPAKTGKLVIVK